jgi:hypothetical protein
MKNRKNNILFIIVISAVGLFACKKSNGVNTSPASDAVDIYIGGVGFPNSSSVNFIAEVWKNGTLTKISDGSKSEGVYAISVSNGDVYLAGNELDSASGYYKPKYWKNGTPVLISNTPGDASGIFVSGNDVYVCGDAQDSLSLKTIPVYWKNNVMVKLSTPTLNTYTRAIFVSDDNVYVVGNVESVMKLWVNGAEKNISAAPIMGSPTAVFVSGNDVYIAGSENIQGNQYRAKYWKNGVGVALTSDTKNAGVSALFVSGTDVYTAGYEIIPTDSTVSGAARYWKNTTQIDLTDGATGDDMTSAIAVDGNNVYVAGTAVYTNAKYWLNGKSVNLPSGGGSWDEATCMVIVKK